MNEMPASDGVSCSKHFGDAVWICGGPLPNLMIFRGYLGIINFLPEKSLNFLPEKSLKLQLILRIILGCLEIVIKLPRSKNM